jgi:hypothetical protein
MRFLLVIPYIIASVLRVPIESFDVAAVAEMDQTLGTMFISSTPSDSNVVSSNESSDEDVENSTQSSSLLNISRLSNRIASAARQAIYYETTATARLRLLIIMNQAYSTWVVAHNRTWAANPKRRCNAIRSMLENDMSLVPTKYREDTISGWLLFCAAGAKFE